MNAAASQPKPPTAGSMRGPGVSQVAGPRVVVGVDGSADSVAALLWAAPVAHRRDAVLQLVSAWDGEGGSECRTSARVAARRLDRALKQVLREKLRPDRIMCTPVKGDPGEVLLDKARGADLLVLGTTPGSDGQVPGATGLYCLRNALVPVVFVAGPFRA